MILERRRPRPISLISKKFNKVMKAFALVMLDEINLIRANAGMSQRTKAQLKTAVKNKYNSLP